MDLFREVAESKILRALERCVGRWWHARRRLSGWKTGAATAAWLLVLPGWGIVTRLWHSRPRGVRGPRRRGR